MVASVLCSALLCSNNPVMERHGLRDATFELLCPVMIFPILGVTVRTSTSIVVSAMPGSYSINGLVVTCDYAVV
jgi:hypothetical protein